MLPLLPNRLILGSEAGVFVFQEKISGNAEIRKVECVGREVVNQLFRIFFKVS